MTTKDLEVWRSHALDLARELDEAIHRSMPPGGNANHERAQLLCNQLAKHLKEAPK